MDDINLDTMGLDYLFEYMNNEMYVRVEAIAATDKNSRMSIYSTDEIVESLDFEKLSEWSIRISTAFTFYGATDNSGERNLPLESTINDLMEHIQEVVTDNLYGPVGGPYVKIYTNHFIDHDTYITNRADSTSWYVAPIAISSVISRHHVSCYAMKWPISW